MELVSKKPLRPIARSERISRPARWPIETASLTLRSRRPQQVELLESTKYPETVIQSVDYAASVGIYLQRLAHHRAQRLAAVRAFHRVPGTRRGDQQIAHPERALLRRGPGPKPLRLRLRQCRATNHANQGRKEAGPACAGAECQLLLKHLVDVAHGRPNVSAIEGQATVSPGESPQVCAVARPYLIDGTAGAGNPDVSPVEDDTGGFGSTQATNRCQICAVASPRKVASINCL